MNRISRIALCAALLGAGLSPHRVHAEPIGPQWPQPGGPGSDIFITYSYVNLLEGSSLLLTPAELRAATEEALALWAQVAPLHFVERVDSGPAPSDEPYSASDYPQIRLGVHLIASSDAIAHAFFPGQNGLAGDIHLDPRVPWSLGITRWNILEALAHEIGHALGLGHEVRPAVMNAFYPQQRFTTLGTGFLFAADIETVQRVYGAGRGSVTPVPEPGTWLLAGAGLVALDRYRRRAKKAARTAGIRAGP